jgi:hypothetical protein
MDRNGAILGSTRWRVNWTGFLSADAYTTIASARNFNLTVSPANYLEHHRTVAKCVCDYSRPRILSMLRHECQSAAGRKHVGQVLERPLKKQVK